MWLSKVFGVIYMIAVCAAQDPTSVSPTSDAPTTPQIETLTTAEPPVPLLTTAWSDVFISERVRLRCSVSGSSDWTFSWYRNGEKLTPGQKHGSLLILDAATEHKGNYTCMGVHKKTSIASKLSNSLQLKVYDKAPKPRVTRSSDLNPMFPGESITLTCKVDVSSGWSYEWILNGTMIKEFNQMVFIASLSPSNSGQYQCKAKRGDRFSTEASESTSLQVSDPPTPSIKLDSSWPDVFEGESVELSCEVIGSEEWEYRWYRDQKLLKEDDDDVLVLDEEWGLLNITSVLQSHQGEYSCKALHKTRQVTSGFGKKSRVSSGFSNITKITIYENIPKPTLRKDSGFNPMYVGETLNLTCSVSVSSGWKYQWFKDEGELSDSSENISVLLTAHHGGEYSCKANRGSTTSTARSEIIRQEVIAIPVPTLKRLSKWLEVFPSESVKLLCGIEGISSWTYTWMRDTKMLRADDTVTFDSDGATLSINAASPQHAGRYECRGHLLGRTVDSPPSTQLNLTVYDKTPIVAVTRYPDYKVMFPGEQVTFTCSIDVPSEWEYLWYNNGKKLDSSLNTYSVKLNGIVDGGSYKCKAKRGIEDVFTTSSSLSVLLQVEDKKPKPSITQQPDVNKMYTGESVSFECKVEASSGWSYNWYKDGLSYLNNSSSLNIANTSLADSGTYKCWANRDITAISTKHSDEQQLHISEIPTPTLTQVTEWLDVFPSEAVSLRCGMQQDVSSWTYVWYNNKVQVQAERHVTFDPDRTTLSINSASASHRGKYTCEGRLKSRRVDSNPSSELILHVYDTKPKVTLIQTPSDQLLHSGDSVSFGCHVNVSSGWSYMWYKDGSLLPGSANNHSIKSLQTTDEGTYKCQIKRGTKAIFHSDHSQVIRLDVDERPQAALILLTGWSEVFSTDILLLKCTVEGSHDAWNYTWFKGEDLIGESHSEKYSVTPQNDPEQSQYRCQGVRSGRPSYSKPSKDFATKNLLLKRRVLLSISGVIFFGIIAVFLGCFVLRFFRKPAEDDPKVEEPIFFPSMAEMKGFNAGDASCPLVEFITDDSLKSPTKEVEENGTVCSETTPLPITPLEEHAGTADNEEDGNIKLVSFQH